MDASTKYQVRAMDYPPSYLKLHESGELERRAREAPDLLAACRVCPRNCDVNRLEDKTAVCRIGRRALVGSYFPHFGEEDCLRGNRGSGTIFFTLCNLRCVFCQNHEISQKRNGREVSPRELADMMLELQARGCHNINFVTPEHVVPQILEALPHAVEGGLRLPIVYNTSAYDSIHSLKLMEGIVDIYMPDFKLWDEGHAKRYLKAADYPEVARAAVREMHRQVGPLLLDEKGLARRGLLVRHLVMPDDIAGTREVMDFLAREISPDTYVNIMDQYFPDGRVYADNYGEINRRIYDIEYKDAMRLADAAGIHRLDYRRSFRSRRLF